MEKPKKPTQHHMGRRAFTHDYARPGFYHITIRVADGLGQPLSTVAGTDADSAAVVLTAVGEAIEHELLTAITAHYPMITVDAYVIMPEHLHFILIVRDPIITAAGRATHLGQVIAGFKTGCNRAYWAATNQPPEAAKTPRALSAPPAAPAAPSAPPVAAGAPAAPSAPGGFAAGAPPPVPPVPPPPPVPPVPPPRPVRPAVLPPGLPPPLPPLPPASRVTPPAVLPSSHRAIAT